VTVKRVMLITPVHPERAAEAVATASEAARAAGVQLVSTVDEHQKHVDAATHIERVADGERPDVCLVLGGDGSILYALRHFAHTGVPVFGINFGTIGFLAAVEREDLANGLERVFSGDFEVLDMPGLTVDLPLDHRTALNDVSFLRQPRGRVAQLSYTIGDEEVGSVRCDGLVAATPAGSTGYNLANSGPILAWGV
jgi:NAD+ kinase